MHIPSAPKEPLSPEQKEKLSELTNQSWNLELVISGAALFTVLQLPDVLDQIFDYIHYNLIVRADGVGRMFPLLAYSIMKVSCYVLFAAFLTNFIMRAFWVGLVGLLAVFPGGIRYDHIPFISNSRQKRMEKELGTLDAYILALDRQCNIVFASAFLFVILLIVLALFYVLVLVANAGLYPLVPAPYREAVKITSFTLLAVYLIISTLSGLPGLKEKPVFIAIQHRLASFSKMLLLGFYRPISFILNTFYSHIPYRKMLRITILVAVIFFGALFIQMLFDMSHLNGRKLTVGRRLYTNRVDSVLIKTTAYDDQRADEQLVPVASIQSDVIREPFIRLFVAYPRALDTLLTSMAPEPRDPDSLSRKEKQRLFANRSLQKLNEILHVRINDSLYTHPGLLFTERGARQQIGWQTVLLPTNLKTGRNYLRIAARAPSSGKEETLLIIPFWYVPEP